MMKPTGKAKASGFEQGGKINKEQKITFGNVNMVEIVRPFKKGK